MAYRRVVIRTVDEGGVSHLQPSFSTETRQVSWRAGRAALLKNVCALNFRRMMTLSIARIQRHAKYARRAPVSYATITANVLEHPRLEPCGRDCFQGTAGLLPPLNAAHYYVQPIAFPHALCRSTQAGAETSAVQSTLSE